MNNHQINGGKAKLEVEDDVIPARGNMEPATGHHGIHNVDVLAQSSGESLSFFRTQAGEINQERRDFMQTLQDQQKEHDRKLERNEERQANERQAAQAMLKQRLQEQRADFDRTIGLLNESIASRPQTSNTSTMQLLAGVIGAFAIVLLGFGIKALLGELL